MLSLKARIIIPPRSTLGASVALRVLSSRASKVLSSLGLPTSDDQVVKGVYDGEWGGTGEPLVSSCPATGETIARVSTATASEVLDAISKSRLAYKTFRNVPAPRRGEIARQIREGIAAKVEPLGALVSLEMGKIRTEGVGEVQEFIDICDYATGLSRMMNGRVIASERAGHSIFEVPNPLGVVGVLSAFNFPVAVYGWNLSLSLAAGNATLWKPAPTTPLCAIAVTRIIARVLERNGIDGAVAGLVCGDKLVGETVVGSPNVDMISFTGSERVGRIVGKNVQDRFGKILLELGGNNAAIVMPDADMSLAFPSVLFSAVGTSGQRCTSTRRLYLHRSIAPVFLERLQAAYATIPIGDPLHPDTLLGPLHTPAAVKIYQDSINDIRESGGSVLTGGFPYVPMQKELEHGNYVLPAIAVPNSSPKTAADRGKVDRIWNQETFAPVLKVALFDELEEAIELNNGVPQGLSSSLWSNDVRNLGKWIGPEGSDAGIVNFNAGTSGAEIGAAFGGNKSTGWGRESGGDAWKQYVRWSACTVNYSREAPLAQGVVFPAAKWEP
ncbi:NAD-aldehyde dehydrogenase [Cantharellus anzutake]|uniref:NAD-aldehyde dehydrogenase n=1 Tax=Cantharellus anzutake TaxID=1750568 RepID=UPI001904BA14|nr:NAD-aldehyde dehydrogenase [Cantharellus anzutake]KAF8336651.1 NAD-aldehyde dehydrogenase [Cantharellus anzutake]